MVIENKIACYSRSDKSFRLLNIDGMPSVNMLTSIGDKETMRKIIN